MKIENEMNFRGKTKNELIKELQKLQLKYDSLKASYERDITGLKMAKEKEALILSSIPLLIYCSETTNNYAATWISENVGHVTGFDRDVFLKETFFWSSRLHPDDRDRVLKTFNTLQESEQGAIEYRWLCANGEYHWFLDSFSSFKKTQEGKIEFIGIWFDITERKQAEEALRESEMKLKTLFEILPIGVSILDAERNIAFVNPALNKTLNITKDGFIRGDYKNRIYLRPDETQMPEEEFASVRAIREQQAVHNVETGVLMEDGHVIWTNVNAAPVEFPDWKVVIITTDITERKKVEEELRIEKENFRHSLDDSPLGVRIATMEGNTIYANKTLLDIYGYDSPEELQKTPLKDRYTPESYVEAKRRKLRRERGDFSDTEYEISIIRKNGEIRHLQVFRKEILWAGFREFQVIYKDITRRKLAEAALRESEAIFRSIFENSLIGISIASPEGKLLQANLAYARMYGYKNPEMMLNEVQDVGELYAQPKKRKEVLRILRRNGFMEAKELELIKKNGSRFFGLVSACEIRDSDGKMLYNQATHIDLTDRKNIEDELRNSKVLFENLNQHLNEIRENERALISREIHDELGQSLTALKLDLYRMHKYVGSNPEAIMKLDSMTELVSNTIKDVQRISSDLRPGILDDLGLVSAIEWYCDEFEKRTAIKCSQKLEDSDYNDPQINLTLFRVLQETLTNVIRHANASSVIINLHRTLKGTALSIKDNGTGIAPEKIGSAKSLGLIGMRERVKQFGGRVDISSEKGKGTKLIIFIPEKKGRVQ